MKSWIEVSEERLAGNFATMVAAAGAETDVLAVVKANAYGHGIEGCSVTLVRAGAKWLGVADVHEGARVRRVLESGLGPGKETTKILVMCGILPEDVAAVMEHNLTPVVWAKEQVEWLRETRAQVHVEIETGMGRQGVRPGAALDELLDAMSEFGIGLDGVLTHFSEAEVAHSEKTQAQEREFERAVAQVRARGLKPAWVHAGSSSSVDNPAQSSAWLVELARSAGARAMVRCGISLYGYCVAIEQAGGEVIESRVRAKLKPVMTWKTRVVDVRDVGVGEAIGYNSTFTAAGAMRVALLPVGYSDGLRRELSSTNARQGGWVMIGGRDGVKQRAEILGRISMNLTVVDVSEAAELELGDEVVLLGDGVTADDHARIAETIAYEILCGVRV